MSEITLNIKGAEQLRNRLQKFAGALPDGIDAVLEVNANEIARNAKRLAPTRKNTGTDSKGRTTEFAGTLRGSINVDNPQKMVWSVAVNARYAPYIEFGTRFAKPGPPDSIPDELRELASYYKAEPLKRATNIRARPFLWPSYVSQIPQLFDDLTNELNSI